MQLSTNSRVVGRCYFKMLLRALYLVAAEIFQYKSASSYLLLCRMHWLFVSVKKLPTSKTRQNTPESVFRKHNFKATLYTSCICSKFRRDRDNKLRAQSLVVKAKSHL